MKIIENRSIGVSSSKMATSDVSASSAKKSGEVSSSQAQSTTASLDSSVSSMRSRQVSLAESDRAVGLISRLAEKVQNHSNPQVISPLQDSVLQAAVSLQHTHPQYAQRLRDSMNNLTVLSTELTVIKRELRNTAKFQRREIAKSLITEQNKDAMAKRGYGSQQAASLLQSMDATKVKDLFGRRPNATDLLQS